MWKRKLFNTHQELLTWLNDKENVLRIQNVQIIKAECNAYYEVFYWDSWVDKKEYY